VDDPHPARWWRVENGVGALGPRPDQLVLPREEALQQLTGRLVARGALVDSPEEDLDEHPGDLGRENPLHGLVEGGDVERLGVTQGRGPGAWSERLVDMQQIE
jgi:hypothetical protein